MKNDRLSLDDARLLSATDGIVKRGYSAIVKNCGKLIAALTAVTVLLVTFTEVGFYDIGTTELTANVLLLLIASYVIYFSLEDAGESLGRESDEYREAAAHLKLSCERVEGGMMVDLRRFVEEYKARELLHRRESLLLSEGLSLADLEAYAEGAEAPGRKGRALKKAARLRPIRLSAGDLLTGVVRHGQEIRNPERTRIPSLAARLIPTTVCTLFTASVMLGVKDGLGAAEVIEALLRLCPLPIVALRGYSAGYSYATEQECEWIRAKCRLLDAYLKTQEGNCKP